MQMPVLISIFAQLANLMPDPKALIDGATCIACNIPPGYQLPVLISLASQILSMGGGVAGGGQLLVYNGASPTADGLVPTNQGQPALAYKANGAGPTYSWNVTTHVWQ